MDENLRRAVSIIVEQFGPEKIILFGSRARKSHSEESDYDLCILKSDLTHKRKAAQQIYRMLLPTGLPVDVLVETPQGFASLAKNPFLIYQSIAQDGEVLYEKQ